MTEYETRDSSPVRRSIPGWWPALLLIPVIFLAYQPVWHAGFIWDDDAHLTKNPCIIGPLGFAAIWTSSSAVYYPLVLTSFWLQHGLWGLAPLPYHLVNIAMHTACALLLWRVLLKLNVRGALLGAALWALHPVMAESVAWVTELKNTQSCFFYLLSILFFLDWREQNTPDAGRMALGRYALALLFALLAILSKSSTVMLPVVLGLCAWWKDRRWRWHNLLSLTPFLFVSLIASLWTIWEQQYHSGARGGEWALTWPARFAIAGDAIWFYLGKLAWPHPLMFIYPRWNIDPSKWMTFLPAFATAGGLFVLWWKRTDVSLRPVFFAAAYFVASLFPVLAFFNIYFFRFSFVSDHFQYLASMGPLALAATGIHTLFVAMGKDRTPLKMAFCGALLLGMAAMTWSQSRIYKNVATLWQSTLLENPGCWLAWNNLGDFLVDNGRIDDAATCYTKALEFNPSYADACNNLGNILRQKDRLTDAIADYRKALDLDPSFTDAHNNLGIALLQQGNAKDAVDQFQKALSIDPGSPEAHYNLGNIMLSQGRADDAVGHYEKALKNRPNDPLYQNNLGTALFYGHHNKKALAHFTRALELKPDYVKVRINLAGLQRANGDPRAAIVQYQRVLELQPSNPEAAANLAWVLATCPDASLRNGAEAIELAEKANQTTGDNQPLILRTLAAAYAEAGQLSDAVKTAQNALQLANSQGNAQLIVILQNELKFYTSGSPYRDSSMAPASSH